MKKIVFFLLAAIIAFGCSDEENEREEPWVEIDIQNPGIEQILLTEICESVESGVQTVTRKDEFSFANGWMTKHASSQEFMSDVSIILTRESNFQYNANHNVATLIDQSDNKSIYTLNEQGYATQCTYTSAGQIRQYTFSYTNGYLTQLTEKITPTDGIGESIISHKLILNYKNGDLVSVVSPSLKNESFSEYGELQINYEAGEDINYYRLPCLQLLDTYPLSFHQDALFAGILGKPTQHLTVQTSPNEIKQGYTEKTKYTYQFDSSGKPTMIQSRTTYGGGNYESGFPNTRNISITID